MNSHDLKLFRSIFDEEMAKEGFVWRYQMYMHVDFEQYWLIGLWPKVANIGYDFSIQYKFKLFSFMDLELLKHAHSQYGESMFSWFEMFDGNLLTTVENFKRVYEQYLQKVKPVFHGIRSSYDAYRFQNNYCNMYSQDQLHYHLGMACIEYLLCINHKEDIPEILKKMKKRQDAWEEFFYTKRPLPWNPKSKDYQQQWERYWMEKQNMQIRRAEIEELERMIAEDDFGDMKPTAEQNMKNKAEVLKKSFSKKEREIMYTSW